MANTSESKEGLPSVIEILTDTAEKFHALDREAEAALMAKIPEKYLEKLKERGQLLVDLPDRLAGALEGLDQKTRGLIDERTSYFAALAQRMIEDENDFGLAALLRHKGSKMGSKNDLEELIADLKRKK